MKKMKKFIFLLLLIASILLTGCGANDSTTEPVLVEYNTKHTNTNFKDMKYVRPDTETLVKKIEGVKNLVSSNEEENKIFEEYNVILDSVSDVMTMFNLTEIYSSFDVRDEYYNTEYDFLINYHNKLDNKMNDLTKTILDSKYADAFKKKMGKPFIEKYEHNTKLNSPIVEPLKEQETALLNEYRTKSIEEYTTTYEGKEVTLGDLDLSDEKTHVAYYEIYKKKNAVKGEIYRELVEVRTKIAEELGYNNYSEYAYDYLIYDFEPEDVKKIQDDVVKYIVPLYQDTRTKYRDKINLANSENTATFEDGIPILKKAIKSEFSDYMNEALSYMLENDLYTFTDDPNAKQSAYSAFISNYTAPYLYVNTAVYTDPSTVFHEFGHYYNFYHYFKSEWNEANDLNLAEVHSQGLEILMHPYYDQLYGDNAKIMQYDNIENMLYSILSATCEDEFQQKVYENPTMSLEEMNALHNELSNKYLNSDDEYEWVRIPHHYETPLYYISYGTSAISSLELWTIEEDDRDDALAIYENISKYPTNQHYLEALNDVGLSNPFESSVIKDIAKTIKKKLKV